jgi:hypothetical protein
MLLAAASRILPGERWKAFVMTPRTLLRWHRELDQTGVAPNGIELHPVLRFTGNCAGGTGPAGQECSPAYPDFCIPPPPPDLSCADVAPHTNFTVLPPDPHGFDGNDNGIGCET